MGRIAENVGRKTIYTAGETNQRLRGLIRQSRKTRKDVMNLLTESILAAALLAGSYAMTNNDADLLLELISQVDTVVEDICPTEVSPA